MPYRINELKQQSAALLNECEEMRLILGVCLLLLSLWLFNAHVLDDSLQRDSCAEVSASEAAASVLLSPLSLYSWLASTLLRLVLSTPAVLLASAHHSVLLLLAWPCSVLSLCASLFLTGLRAAIYLLHVAAAIALAAAMTAARRGDLSEPDPGPAVHRVARQGCL